MKKTILLIFIIFLLTGCNSKYNIHIDENKIYDNIEIYEDSGIIKNANKKQTDEFNDYLLDWERGYDFYKRELYATDKITGYRYTYDFTFEEYDAMTQLRKCYETFEFKNNNIISLNTSEEFLCGDYYPNVGQVEINITSKYEIIESNADKKNNNKHTWIINKKNYKNKPIVLKIDKGSEHLDIKPSQKFTTKQIIITTIFIILVITLISRRKRRNK